MFRDPIELVKDGFVSMLLPYELADELWRLNEQRFREVFAVSKIPAFWERTISVGEEWFLAHPLHDEIVDTTDRSRFLPILLFGDDGCLRKSRSFTTLKWYPAFHAPAHCLHSKFPLYIMARHTLVPGVTEIDVERATVWAFDVWVSGRHPHVNPAGERWADKRRQDLVGTELTPREQKSISNPHHHESPFNHPPQIAFYNSYA